MQYDRDEVQHRWATAVEAYRRSVDLYRQVIELRARQGRRPEPVLPLPTQVSQLLERDEASSVRLDALTLREREVACLIARGYTNAQIAEVLVVTRGTVANHVAHILSKLDLANRTQLAAFVTREQSEPSHQSAG